MQFRLGPWLVHPDMDAIVRDGQARHVSPRAMEVLLCLARRQGQVVGKEEFFKEIWKETFVSDDALTRCIGELRRAFHDGSPEPAVIRTIAKHGYLLLPPVVWEPGGTAPIPATNSSEPAATHQDRGSVSRSSIDGADVHSTHIYRQRPVWRRAWFVVGVIAVCIAVGMFLVVNARRGHTRPHAIRSIAVLPLANLSGDAEEEYLADGVTDQLITALAQLGACEVISRTSVLRYKETKLPLQDIAHELSVDAVVEGTVLRSGSRVRVSAKLIDATTDRHLWSGSFEREMSDVLSFQAGIARSIADELNPRLTSTEQGQVGQ